MVRACPSPNWSCWLLQPLVHSMPTKRVMKLIIINGHSTAIVDTRSCADMRSKGAEFVGGADTVMVYCSGC